MRIVDGLAVPELKAADLARIAGIETTAVDIATVGGPQLNFPDLVRADRTIRAAAERGAKGAIVTLGTDAIEEVAAFFSYSGPWALNIAITGAMVPGAEPDSDGPLNLRDAAAVVSGPTLSEPVVVFAGHVALARAVVKISGLELDPFTSPTAPVWPVAEVVQAGSLPDVGDPPPVPGHPDAGTVEVPIISSMLAAQAELQPLPGDYPPALVCTASGAGNLTPDAANIAIAALERGSVVAIATRALDRRLSQGYGYPGGSGTLAAAGAVLAEGMSPHRLRMLLLICLSQGMRGEQLKQALIAHVDALRTARGVG